MCFFAANGVSLLLYALGTAGDRGTDLMLKLDVDPLDIDLIQPVRTISAGLADGFDKLVLPAGHKDIVRALVKTHAKKLEGTEAKTPINIQREFDIVKGKGKGLIILLHGAPGMQTRLREVYLILAKPC